MFSLWSIVTGVQPLHRMQTMLLDELLRPYRNKRVFYFPNPGNAGDSVIAAATMQAFRRNGITFEEMKGDSPVDGEVVFLGGGGNFIPLYTGMRWAMGHVHQRAKEVILLPHTVRGNEDILQKLGPNVTIICREIESYRHVVQNTARCNVALGHDMAFHLDPDEIAQSITNVKALEDTFEKRLLDYKVTRDRITDPEVTVFARRDGESTGQLQDGAIDISDAYAYGCGPGNAERATWCFIHAINLAKAVRTDRLHIGIVAAILNKTCELMDNSYGKNTAIYEHSIKNYFPHVRMPLVP